jgi:hypothetical protein
VESLYWSFEFSVEVLLNQRPPITGFNPLHVRQALYSPIQKKRESKTMPRTSRLCRHHLRFLALALLISAAAQAQTQRIQLAITAEIGNTSGAQCGLSSAALATALDHPSAKNLILTEKDIVHWDTDKGDITLPRDRFGDPWRIQDHCFVLTIDGKPVASGMALSSHTARLTRFPILQVITAGSTGDLRNGVVLRLTSGNEGGAVRPIFRNELDTVLYGINDAGNDTGPTYSGR